MDAAGMLLDVRRRASLTQQELARRVGIPATVLSAYENGRREPGADVFLRIVRAAGFEATVRMLPDPEACARRLAAALHEADSHRREPRPMGFANVCWRRVGSAAGADVSGARGAGR